MTRSRRALLASFVVLACPCFAACIAPRPPPIAAPAAEAPPTLFAKGEVSPVDTEMLAIGRAEDEIDRLFPQAAGGHKQAEKKKDSRDEGYRFNDDPARRAPSRAPAPSAKPESAPSGAPSSAPSGGSEGCEPACKALGTMLASAEHLCQLAGENDGRCEDARARVRGASARVMAACPACSVKKP